MHKPQRDFFLQATDWILQLSFDHVIFEFDCKTVVDSFNKHTTGLSDFHVILAKCRTNISIILNSKVSFLRKQTNHDVHSLVIYLFYFL